MLQHDGAAWQMEHSPCWQLCQRVMQRLAWFVEDLIPTPVHGCRPTAGPEMAWRLSVALHAHSLLHARHSVCSVLSNAEQQSSQ